MKLSKIAIYSLLIFSLYICIGVGFLAGGFFLFRNITASPVSSQKLAQEFDKNPEIKKDYVLDKSAIKITPKDQNSVGIILGDASAKEFVPNLEINKWNNETKFKLKPDISNVPADQKKVTMDGDKINYETPKVIYQYYNKPDASEEGGFEFSEILKEKPDTNVFETPIETENLDFFYQPALDQEVKIGEQGVVSCTETECLDKNGKVVNERPENVVGSYAVYYKDGKSDDYSMMGGKNYMSGKAFHIYRPQIIDADGNKIWGELKVDTTKNKLSITVPQDFLDKAVYPVVVDPTFGYTTAGTSQTTGGNTIQGGRFTTGVAGILSSISVSCHIPFAGMNDNAKAGVYNGDAFVDGSNEVLVTNATKHWETFSGLTQSISASTSYGLVIFSSNVNFGASPYYDTTGGSGITAYQVYGSWPGTVTFSTNTRKYSIYATYSAYSATTTEFVSVVDPGNSNGTGVGTDYTSLSAWNTGVATNLTLATTKVFAGTKTGTIGDNATVTGATSGATATVVHANAAGTQLLLENINGDFQSGEQIRIDVSNYFTTSNAGDQAIAVAKCRTTTGVADTTAVTITGWTTSATNYIKIWTDPTENYRHQGKWDDGKYRLEAATAGLPVLSIKENYTQIYGLQVKNTQNWGSTTGIAIVDGGAYDITGVKIGYCIANSVVSFGFGTDYTTGTNYIYNCLSLGHDGFSWRAGTTLYNCTAAGGGGIGFKNEYAVASAYNCLSTGYDTDFAQSGTPNPSLYNCASEDGTADDFSGSNNRVNQIFSFVNSGSGDFHLASNDTGAKDYGVSDPGSGLFSTDIDGQARTGSWDIGSDESATAIFYSVGQNTSNHMTGSPTVSIASGVGTFSVGQTAPNMGVGDVVTYNTNVVAYISEKISDSKWKLVTAVGANPDDISGSTVVSIAHAYDSLSNAEAGIPTPLGTSDLVTGNYQLNIPCYYDTGADQTAVTVDGWTTGSANYIKIYAPNDTVSEVNQSQRHEGKWDDNKYRLEAASYINLSITVNYIKIDGLQFKNNNSVNNNCTAISRSGGITGDSAIYISNNIVWGNATLTNGGYDGISVTSHTGSTAYIWNNIIYGFNLNSAGRGINISGYDLTNKNGYIYNNTVYGCYYGIVTDDNLGSFTIKNNLSYNNTTDYVANPSFNSNSANNISEDATSPNSGSTDCGGHSCRTQTVVFADTATNDFRLSMADSSAKDAGTNLSADSNLAFRDDVSGNHRPGAGMSGWDIGASEAGQTIMNSSEQKVQSNTDGLVLYQSFDGQDINGTTSIDRSGEGNDGTISGATPTTGKRGQALSFDGSDYVTVNSSTLEPAEMTVSFWENPADITSFYRIIDDQDNGAYLIRQTNEGRIQIITSFGCGGNFVSNASNNAGAWNHWVITAGSSGCRIYLNGALDNSTGTSFTGRQGMDTLYIGGSLDLFNGSLDEVRVYNRALSADEIGSLYRLGNVQMSSSQATNANNGLVLSQSFDGKYITGATAVDASGLGNNGTISGATPTIGKLGQALSFNGSSSYVNVTDASSLNPTNVSMSAWVKTSTTGGYIIAKDPPELMQSASQEANSAEEKTVWQKAVDFVKSSGQEILSWLGSSADSPENSIVSAVAGNNKASAEMINYNTDVSDLGGGKKKYEIHAGQINYKDDATGELEKIDTTLLSADYGWNMDKASYDLELPQYADDWFNFINDYKEGEQETVAMKPTGVSHIKGELIESNESGESQKSILYKNAFGNNTDLKVVAKNIGFDKLVVINEKPQDLSQDLEFSFVIGLDGFGVESGGKIWNQKEPLITSQGIILNKLKQTWFREFKVWDSAGKSGKIKVRLEEKNGQYVFTKIIPKEFFANAVYPVYTDDTTSYYAGAGDGYEYSGFQASWDEAHDTDGTYGGYGYTGIITRAQVGTDRIYRSFFPIDTSGIDDSATISNALLYLSVGAGIVNNDNDGDDYLNVVQTTQASPTSLSLAEFDHCGNVDSPTLGGTSVDVSTLTNGLYFSIILNTTGISWIKKTAGDPYTMLGVREGHDIIDSAAVGTNTVYFSTSEDTSGTKDPYLEVTTAPAGKTNVPYALSTVNGGQFLIKNSSTDYAATSSVSVADGAWHHLVGTYDGTTMKIYVDGVQTGTQTGFTGNLPSLAGALHIGADYQSTPGNYFNGSIDEVRVYNRALSADEVGDLYRMGEVEISK